MTANDENSGLGVIDGIDLDAALAGSTEQEATGPELDLAALLDAAPEDENVTRELQRFNFERPSRLSRQFEQNLLSVAENFAQVATIDFTKRLRASTTVAFEAIRLVPCDDYLARLPNPTCVAQVSFEPINAPCLIHLDLGICFVLLKKLMGGRPDPEAGLRTFTEIERGLFTAQIEFLTAEFARACSKLVEIKPSLRHLENNPNYLTGLPQGEALVCFRYEIRLEAVVGPLEVVVPLPGFRPVRDVFDPEQARENRDRDEVREDRAKILATISETSHDLVVKLAEMPISLARVIALQPGDLLTLPQPVTAPLVVEIAGQEAYRGEAGRVGSQRAVRLTARINEE